MKKPLLLIFILFFLATSSVFSQWAEQHTGFSTPLRGLQSISAADNNTVWAVAFDGSGNGNYVQEFTKTVDGGSTWTPGNISAASALSSTFDASSIFALNENVAWVAMHDTINDDGAIFKTTDGGANWTEQTTAAFAPPHGYPNFLYFWDANTGIAVGDPNAVSGSLYYEIYTTVDGGNNWTRVPETNIAAPLSGEFGLIDTYETMGDTVWFGTTSGRIYRSVDKGLTWTVATSPFSIATDVTAIAFKDNMNGLATGSLSAAPYTNQGIIKTSDGGETWTMLNNGVTGGISIKNDIKYAKGTNGTYYITGSEGGSWGSAITHDDGNTWTNIDQIKHYKLEMIDNTIGWSGSFNFSSTSGGVFRWSFPTVIEDESGTATSLEIYPNPGNGYYNLTYHDPAAEHVIYTIYDMTGKKMVTGDFSPSGSIIAATIDISSYADGIYLLRVSAGEQVYTKKIVKK